jgi:hypothetical protein
MSKMNHRIDPRMELLTALQLVSGDPNIDRNGCKYYEDMVAWFDQYREHPAVLHYRSINEHFCFDAPINSMLFMEFGDRLTLISEPPEYYYLRAGDKQSWLDFFNGLQDFAAVSSFREFYNAHLDYYQEALQKVEAINGNCDPAAELEAYLGLGSECYTFIFSPLQTCGYGGCHLPWTEEVTCTIGFDLDKQDDRAEICLRVYLWHEFGHYYVNPLLDDYLAQNPSVNQAFTKFITHLQIDEDKFPSVNYYECCVRAITHKLNEIYYGKQEADMILACEESDGFAYIRHFIRALSTFEQAREQNRTNIKDYFPILLNDVINNPIS